MLGGLDKHTRFSDLWLFDWDTKDWAPVTPAAGPGPGPRAHFTANLVGDRLYVFGGYAGYGEVHHDMWVLHVPPAGSGGAFTWEEITPSLQGTGPCGRFDHAAFAYPTEANSDAPSRLVVLGGRDLSAMLSDAFALDLASLTWSSEPRLAMGYEACSAVAHAIPSVPYHKVGGWRVGGKARGQLSQPAAWGYVAVGQVHAMQCP